MALLRILPPGRNQVGRYKGACQHLCRADLVLAGLIRKVGPCHLQPRRDYFATLCDSIISQQLSPMAAATIFDRFAALYSGRRPSPFAVRETPMTRLRAAGLSPQKASYVKDLAAGFMNGRIQPRRFVRRTNEEIIDALSSIKGIGRWTAEMFLIFSLNRLDVLPVDDLGIQKAVKRWYGLRTLPSATKLGTIGKAWSPYQTLACWYLWQGQRL